MGSLKELLFVSLAFLGAASSIVALAATAEHTTCKAKTKNISMASDWGFWSGCLVQLPDGSWVPLENYRAL